MAPKCAAFVEEMRAAFGVDQVEVLMVSEGKLHFDKRKHG
jgi:hypothetical protein